MSNPLSRSGAILLPAQARAPATTPTKGEEVAAYMNARNNTLGKSAAGIPVHLPHILFANISDTKNITTRREPYTVYVIDVSIDGLNEFQVCKRYSELMDLYVKLQTRYPHVEIAFPPKKSFGKMRSSVIEMRKVQLQQFLNTAVHHGLLSHDLSVYAFLCPQMFTEKVSDVASAVSLITLPNELFVRCLGLLPFTDVLSLSRVSSHLCNFISSHHTMWASRIHVRFNTTFLNRRNSITLPTPTTPIQSTPPRASRRGSTQSSPAIGLTVPMPPTIGSSADKLGIKKYTRLYFISHMKAFHKIRIHPAKTSADCDCESRKLVGVIVGDPSVGKTSFLESIDTRIISGSSALGPRTNSSTSLSSLEGPDGNIQRSFSETSLNSLDQSDDPMNVEPRENYMLSHVVCNNGALLCFQIHDSTSDFADISRGKNLSVANFVIVCFSVIDNDSFEAAKHRWIPLVRDFCPEVPIILVGTMCDLRSKDKPYVTLEEGLAAQKQLSLFLYAEADSLSSRDSAWKNSILAEHGWGLLERIEPTVRLVKPPFKEKLNFMHKLFPNHSSEGIQAGLASCMGDIAQSATFLENHNSTFSEQNLRSTASSISPTTNSFSPSKNSPTETHGSPQKDGLSVSEEDEMMWRRDLRQSWRHEIYNMETTVRSHFISEAVDAGLAISVRGEGDPLSPMPSKSAPSSIELTSQRTAYIEKVKRNSIDGKFLREFLRRKMTLQQQSESVVAFLTEVTNHLSKHALWANLEDDKELTKAREDIERHLFSKIHRSTFFGTCKSDRDPFFSSRISKLSFVKPSNLDIDQAYYNRDLWDAAGHEIMQINQFVTPGDKLTCILNCCKAIIFLLADGETAGGADDFLPHLIYVLIRSNPDFLQTNMDFIARFSGPEVMRMEKYYYYTTLSVAVSFIENVDSTSLNLAPEEYDRLMNDRLVPLTKNPRLGDRSFKKAHKLLGLEPQKDKLKQKLGLDEKTLLRASNESFLVHSDSGSESGSVDENEQPSSLFKPSKLSIISNGRDL